MGRLFPCAACKRHFFLSERVCPHCGVSSIDTSGVDTSGVDNRMALVLAIVASVGAAACSEPPVAVYGPAPVNPDRRTSTSSGDPGAPTNTSSPTASPTDTAPTPTGPTASADPPPSGGPSAAPSGVASTKPQPTASPTPTAPPKPVPVALYGPTPRDPNRRTP